MQWKCNFKRHVGLGAALGAAVCFGTTGVLVKLAYAAGAPPLTLLAGRAALAAVLIWPLALWGSRPGAGPLALPPRHRLLGLFLGALHVPPAIAFFLALERISASLAIIIFYTFPAWTALLALLVFREPLTRVHLSSLALTFAGLTLVVEVYGTGTALAADLPGVLLALGMAVGVAIHSLIMQPVTRRVAPLSLSPWMLSAEALIVAAIRAPTEALELGGTVLVLLFLLSSLGMALPMVLWLVGIQHLGASRAGVVATIEPVVTIGLAFALLGERLSPIQLLGVALVLGGVGLLSQREALPAPGAVPGP